MRRFMLAMAALLLWGASQGLASEPSGTARGVNPEATALLGSETRALVAGSDIFMGDRIVTGDSGQVQIKFTDGTELVVGPHSSLVIDTYLIRNDGSIGKLAVNMLAGSFRFVTGKSAKEAYLITTPSGTIGVRGTAFDVFVGADGTVRVLRYRGTVILCTAANTCAQLSESCELGELTDLDALLLGHPDHILGDDRETLRQEFIYAEAQTPLLREFWVQEAYRCLHRAAEPVPEQEHKPKPQNTG